MSDLLIDYCRLWNLTDPQPLAGTPTSRVYTVTLDGVRVVLKLLTPLGAEDEGRGAIALRWFDGHGAVRLLRADDHAHLLEYADGESLIDVVKRGADDSATAIIADVLNRLHAAPPADLPDGLTPLFTQARRT